MTHAEYTKRENELKGELARTNPAKFFAIEAFHFAGAMALMLVIIDLTPWPLWDNPLSRLGFILFWAIGMTLWRRSQLKKAGASVTAGSSVTH